MWSNKRNKAFCILCLAKYNPDRATLVTRVYEDKDYVEVEWVVGPLPGDVGREVIIRYYYRVM